MKPPVRLQFGHSDQLVDDLFPAVIPNWIGGRETMAADNRVADKLNPATGRLLSRLARSGKAEIDAAVAAASAAQPAWAATPAVQRGTILHAVAMRLKAREEDTARVVALETGKSFKEALGETSGAVAQGLFMAGEGMRLYGRTTTSAVPNKRAMTVRHPLGIAGLIVAANTPIANIAWKVFPALICGNGVVLKAPEDTPATAWLFGKIAAEAGLPEGLLNIVQGLGPEAGAALVAHPKVPVISFTGSAAVGREIARVCGDRLAKISLELGGKNALLVCDDADLNKAVDWSILSAFSNAGQRCASGSRLIVFDSIYDSFRDRLIERAKKLRVGSGDGGDLGPVINARQLNRMLAAIERASEEGARVLCGGKRLTDPDHNGGFYVEPTILEDCDPRGEISTTELFGPITCLYRVRDFAEGLSLVNQSPYGLTACIHTKNLDRAFEFTQRVEAGVAVVNAGTYGSEPHMPFGGIKQSGNGSREPGTEALDIYSNLKDIYIVVDPDAV